MADTLTPAKGLTQQTVGGNRNAWGTVLNNTIGLIDSALGGTLVKSISGDVTLTSTEVQNSGYKFTGTLSDTATITWPSFAGIAVIQNDTTGGQPIICGAGSTTVTVLNDETIAVWADSSGNFCRLAQVGGGQVPSPDIDVRLFGARCDGSTDDTLSINNALSFLGGLGGGKVRIPPAVTCIVSSTLLIPAQTILVGSGDGSIIKSSTANINIIVLSGSYSGVEGVQILCSTDVGGNSAGSAILASSSIREIDIRNVRIVNPYCGIYLGTSILATVEDSYIYTPTPTTGRGIIVNGGNNQVISNVFIQGDQANQPFCGIEIQDTEGIWMSNCQGLWTGNGCVIDPGTGQSITWIFDQQSAYDNCNGAGYLISPTGTGFVRGAFFTETWSSTCEIGFKMVGLSTTGIDDVHLIGHRSYNNEQDGININQYATNVSVTGGAVRGNGTSASNTYQGITFDCSQIKITGTGIGAGAGFIASHAFGVYANSNAANFTITGCQLNHNLTAGVALATGCADATIVGNDLTSNPNPIAFGSSISHAIINNNLGLDDQVPTVASASTTTLPPNPAVFVTGTSTITTINGGWEGREVCLLPLAAFSTGTGGNIQGAITATPHVPVFAIQAGGNWYLR